MNDLRLVIDDGSKASIVQGEDREIALRVATGQFLEPVDLTGAVVHVDLPLPGAKKLWRSTGGRIVTANAATEQLTATRHGLANGDRVRFSSTGTLPAGLVSATDYYVRDAEADTFRVAATVGGDAVNVTDAGTGVHSVLPGGVEIVSAPRGELRLTLDERETALLYAAIGQKIDVEFTVAGRTRVIVAERALDVLPQAFP